MELSVAVYLLEGGLFSLGKKNSLGLSQERKEDCLVYGFILLTRQCWERVTFIFQIMIHARGLPPAFDLGELLMIYSRRTVR